MSARSHTKTTFILDCPLLHRMWIEHLWLCVIFHVRVRRVLEDKRVCLSKKKKKKTKIKEFKKFIYYHSGTHNHGAKDLWCTICPKKLEPTIYIYIHFKVDRPKTPDIYSDLHAPTLFFKFILLALIHRAHVFHWNISNWSSIFKLNILLHPWVPINLVGKVTQLVKFF